MADSLTLPILQGFTGAPAPTSPAAFTITYNTAPAPGATIPGLGGAAICGVGFEGALPCIGVMGATQLPGPPNFVLSSSSAATRAPCGVAGFATFGGIGVYGQGRTGDGVVGETTFGDAAGVTGHNLTNFGTGVHGIGGTGSGTKPPPGGTGVYGESLSNGAHGFLGGSDPVFNQQAGVYGQSDQQGVMGLTTVDSGTGVYGGGAKKAGDPGAGCIGVRGETFTGVGVQGRSLGAGMAGQFIGDVTGKLIGNIDVQGGMTVGADISLNGDLLLANKDIAECFPVNDIARCEPGMVMIIRDDGLLGPCSHLYDKRTIGVVSGAGDLRPAITLGAIGAPAASVRIALIGTANCYVDANHAPIETGDLITSSNTVGHGMKAVDSERKDGAIIGKALAPLHSGQGLIPILLMLK